MNSTHCINKNKDNLYYFKLGTLCFFACWFSIAFLTNLFDLLNTLQITHEWKFHSGNYLALKKVIDTYSTPTAILNFLFVSDVFIQGLVAILFSFASLFYLTGRNAWPCIYLAFAISMALWAIFLILEEIFIAYAYEATHIRLLVLEIVSLLLLHWQRH